MSTPDRPPPSPPQEDNWVLRLLSAVKGLSFSNALVILVLVIALVPAYLLYTVVNDPTLMNQFLSHYREVASDKSPCTLRVASTSGGPEQFAISTGFAYEGSDRWTVAVILDRKPDESDMLSYCTTLMLIVDFMRRPEASSPPFPGTDRPLIWQYPKEGDDAQ
jgi:hypothetical protein